MNYNDYYKARKIVVEIMKKDWLGPVKEDEIICDERPLDYYIVGKLYPQESTMEESNRSPSEDCGELEDDNLVSLSNSRNPSSFGLSFSLNGDINEFVISAKAAKYVLIERVVAQERLGFEDSDYKSNAYFWERMPLSINPISVDVTELKKSKFAKFELAHQLSVKVILHKVYSDDTKTISVTMINDEKSTGDFKYDCLKSVFQPEIVITAKRNQAFGNIRRNISLAGNSEKQENREIAELEMLYSKFMDYASGHGCAVSWEIDNLGYATLLRTDFLPDYELKQMMPTQTFKHEILQMKFLAEASQQQVISGLELLLSHYEEWIDDTEQKISSLALHHKPSAADNISKCRSTLQTLKNSVICMNNTDVFRAFSLANKAMFMQRKKMLQNTNKFTADDNITWFPFQLAFFVQEVISFAQPTATERNEVDLLWFPTGGGKTEAYLGIAAFVIFLRRLRNEEKSNGVTVLMRYTLRLLSFQQFERASALICACEIIRKAQHILGGEISIGLWAGLSLTPNKIEKADKILRGEKDEDAPSSNPAQFQKCPWCGEHISKSDYSCDFKNKRMIIRCGNLSCEFSAGLPVYLIDEEIYKYTPTFIVSTVDKFAQIALNSDTSALFGKSLGKLPPELIIQDELHLISGPLGTITGLYESAIRKLCECNGILPKVIASTATIRNAKEQIKGLYASDYTQFPPQGIDINDSFFANLSTREEKPARFYLGCMAVGTSPTTMMIRVFASLLYSTRYLIEQGYDEKVIDSFWTLTGYFNTLRELGGAIIRVVDDIQDRFTYLRTSKFRDIYPLTSQRKRYDLYKELTSREQSENIGNVIQNELKIPYKADGSTAPYDFLLSSNMISVGVDVGRLGSMVVVGQPKTTSEYIQATSRVGRETPGLVITTYNQAKSRDRSHYEDFLQYHSTFYKFVEATSVTPFSDRARDRALQALYVILCRNMVPQLFADKDAINFNRSISELEGIRQYILSYIEQVDPDEIDNAKADIEEIEVEWELKSARRNPQTDKLVYRKTRYTNESDALFQPDYNESSRFRVLNTMRSVETSVKVITKER